MEWIKYHEAESIRPENRAQHLSDAGKEYDTLVHLMEVRPAMH